MYQKISFFSLFLLINIMVANSISITVYSSSTSKVGIFILAGQSNASGRGELNATTETPYSRVLMFGNDYQWKTAYEPVDDALNQVDGISNDSAVITSTKGHTFSLKAAKDLIASSLDSAIIIPCPKGGTTISEWRRGVDPFDRNTLFGSCNYRRVTAAPNGVTGLWWYQGESNSPNTFISQNDALMGEFRSEMGALLPIVYVQLARNLDSTSNTNQFKVGECQRQMETGSAYYSSLSNHFMVVAFDLPLTDGVHINQAAQIELGRRIALSTREHIYGESVDGTGPRLATAYALTQPGGDKSKLRIQFDRPINAAINKYDNQFKVFDNNTAVSITSVFRDVADTSALIITLSTTIQGDPTVTYGDIPAPSVGTWLTNIIKGANGLPTPRFGPIGLPSEIVDNTSIYFSVIAGTWGTNNLPGKYGSDYRFIASSTGSEKVRWTGYTPVPGLYEVSTWYLQGANRPINSPFTIVSNSGSTTFRINQTINGSQWLSLGTYPFTAGTGYVELSNDAELEKFVIADAVRFQYMGPLTAILNWELYR